VCDTIFKTMERHGVLNVTLPILQNRELWEETGRWRSYVESQTIFRTLDEHKGTEFGLAPTAEEMVTALVAGDVKSWRELPLYLHQIGPKFRDELRPRGGLLRGREFSMSDAYSFDRDEAGMRASFELFRQIYTEIFERLGMEGVISVQADSGAIGGTGSAEFMALNDAGEDTLLTCDTCDYGANAEKAASRYPPAPDGGDPRPAKKVPTPGVKTVEQLKAQFPDIEASQMVKTLLFATDGVPDGESLVAVCIRGDLEVNEIKLANEIGRSVKPASAEEIERATGTPPGFAGPIDLRGVGEIYFDHSVAKMRNFLCGGNEEDVHYLDVNFGHDVPAPRDFVDVHLATGGGGCPECQGQLVESRGIELGHIFMLQRGYAKALGATFSDESGEERDMWMGCYGIGTTRLLQGIAEQNRDEDGLIWPAPVAPFDVHVVLTRPTDEAQLRMLDETAEALGKLDLSVLADDRDVSPGVKFKDADLIGCPLRLTIGRNAEEGKVEVRERATGKTEVIDASDLFEAITANHARNATALK